MDNNTDLKLKWKSEKHIRTDILNTFSYCGNKQKITYKTHEFSAVCPFSGLPDIADIEIIYIPRKLCIELKSLKLYFVSFRDVGIYQEQVTDRVYKDLKQLIEPEYLKIKTTYATRGGIDAICEIESDSVD